MSPRHQINISPLRSGDEQEVSNLVYNCLDSTISKYYGPEVINFLKNLYTPKRVLWQIYGPGSEGREAYVARVNGKPVWTCSYEHLGPEFEIGMFYGLPTLSGIHGAKSLIHQLEDDLVKRQANILTGNVLIPARAFLEKMGGRNGVIRFSEPIYVTDTDPETQEEVLIDVLRYSYTPARITSNVKGSANGNKKRGRRPTGSFPRNLGPCVDSLIPNGQLI